jgi:type VI protein secretion system component Hcp
LWELLDSIDGASTTKGHEKEIEVVSYDQSIDSTVPSGGGALNGMSLRVRSRGLALNHQRVCSSNNSTCA